jgi:hypothetical protein
MVIAPKKILYKRFGSADGVDSSVSPKNTFLHFLILDSVRISLLSFMSAKNDLACCVIIQISQKL